MIRSRSPYNYNTPWTSPASSKQCVSYTLKIYLFNGAKAGISLTTPTKSWTIYNTGGLSDGYDTIDLSRIIKDYVEPLTAVGTGVQLLDGNAQWWIRSEVVYVTDTTEAPQFSTTQLFGRGYSNGNEGENITTITDNILLDGREFNVSRDGVAIIPIYSPDNTAPTITVISYPDNQINETPIPLGLGLTQNQSNQATQYLWIDTSLAYSDTYISVKVGSVDPIPEIILVIEDEFKYTPIDIAFFNKYGVLQTLTFFKEFVKDLNLTKETYQSDNGQASNGNHQFRSYNVQGREGFKVQSGWVEESMNETFKQFLLSEKQWELNNGNYIPLNLETSQFNYKTQKIDKLIQYEIEFKYSFNAIDN